jgi:acetyl-CoA synthase
MEEKPYDKEPNIGHLTDAEVRSLGVPLVTGDIPGFVVLIGAAPSTELAVKIIKITKRRASWYFWSVIASIRQSKAM